MPDFDWSRFNAEHNGANPAAEGHSVEEHHKAHHSQYEPIFQMAMARFEENFEAFLKHYDDKDSEAVALFLHLFESAVVHSLNIGSGQAEQHGGEFDEIAAVFCGAGFGFILGRTFQEFEVKHLLSNDDFRVIGQTVTTVDGTSEI